MTQSYDIELIEYNKSNEISILVELVYGIE